MRSSWTCMLAVALIVPAALRAQGDSFDSNGVRIRYIVEGSGEPVVLVHGFGLGAAMWMGSPPVAAPLLPALANAYRVIALDVRGHGGSGKPHDPAKYGAEMGADVIRLLDRLDLQKAHVVGYSMGAAIAGKLLADHPDRLLSATFVGGGPMFGPPGAFEEMLAATADSLEAGNGAGPLVISLTPLGQPTPSPEEVAALSARVYAGQDHKALAAVLRSTGGLRVSKAELRASRVPVCFVYGSREAGPRELVAAAQKLLLHATVTVIEGGDHLNTPGRPEFREAVRECLRAAGGKVGR